MWGMDEWEYLEHEVITDPKGRQWTVALMDVLGQKGDPDMPEFSIPPAVISLSYTRTAGRYSGSGATPL
jgi:hypothetical protein